MASFTVRVELHNATEGDYEELHAAMENEGFIRPIQGSDGKVYRLPTAEYNRVLDGLTRGYGLARRQVRCIINGTQTLGFGHRIERAYLVTRRGQMKYQARSSVAIASGLAIVFHSSSEVGLARIRRRPVRAGGHYIPSPVHLFSGVIRRSLFRTLSK